MQKGCDKMAYISEKEANERIFRLRKNGHKMGAGYTYQCKHCNLWHLTHYTKRQYRNHQKSFKTECV